MRSSDETSDLGEPRTTGMGRTSPEGRTNAAWLAALEGREPSCVPLLEELQALVRATVSRILGPDEDPQDREDLVQDAFIQVLRSRRAFRGDSAFTTWAVGIVTRVAFTELRRRRVRAGRHVPFDEVEASARERASGVADDPSNDSLRRDLGNRIRRAIHSALTPRQRIAVLAELEGLPTVEIADRMGTNTNALYKLVHDARKKLRTALVADGLDAGVLGEIRGDGSR